MLVFVNAHILDKQKMSDDSDKDSSESTVSKNLSILKENENDEAILEAMDFLQAKARGNGFYI